MDLGVLVFEECADWEVTHLLTQLRACGQKATLMSPGGGTVRAASGFVLETQALRSVEFLVLPGGEPWLTDSLLDEVVEAHAGPVVAISAATLGLARCGRLNHRRHTGGYPSEMHALPHYHGSLLYQENESCVRDGDLLTAQASGVLECAREVLVWTGALPLEHAEAWYDLYRQGVARPLPAPGRPRANFLQLAPLEPRHWREVARIYEEGMASLAGLETEVPEWEAWDRAHLPHSRLVAAVEGGCCYRGVAELSVYVGGQYQRRGVGGLLLEGLLGSLGEHGFWTVQAQIIRENVGSLALHRQSGFRIVGVRERIGQREGRWHDVILLEKRLTPKRSNNISEVDCQ